MPSTAPPSAVHTVSVVGGGGGGGGGVEHSLQSSTPLPSPLAHEGVWYRARLPSQEEETERTDAAYVWWLFSAFPSSRDATSRNLRTKSPSASSDFAHGCGGGGAVDDDDLTLA